MSSEGQYAVSPDRLRNVCYLKQPPKNGLVATGQLLPDGRS